MIISLDINGVAVRYLEAENVTEPDKRHGMPHTTYYLVNMGVV